MDTLDVRTKSPHSQIGYLILRESQAAAACRQAFESLSNRNKRKVTYCDLSFAAIGEGKYIAVVRVHCVYNGKEASFVSGGAKPFRLGSSDPETCLSAEEVLSSMQYFFGRDPWWLRFPRWLKSLI
ncbi:MAG: hypothetical protein Q8Q13_00165 [bacterium]|nr:hypothetical protein [bacterium]